MKITLRNPLARHPLCIFLIIIGLALPLKAEESSDLERALDKLAKRIHSNKLLREPVLVLDLEEMDGRVTLLNQYLSDQLSTRLSNRVKIATVPRDVYAAHLKESAGTGDSRSRTRDIAKKMGARTIVMGTATDLANQISLNVQIHNTEDGAIHGGVVKDIRKTPEIEALIDSLNTKEDLQEQDRIVNRRVEEIKMDQAIQARIQTMKHQEARSEQGKTALSNNGEYQEDLSQMWKKLQDSVNKD